MTQVRVIYSLRRRLVAMLILAVAALWSLSAVVAFRIAHEEADELFDAQLMQVAETLLAIVAAGQSPQVAQEMAEHQHAYQLPVAFQALVHDEQGRWQLLVRSSEMPEQPVTGSAGFEERELDGELWRFVTLDHGHSPYRVIVGQNHGARYRLAGEVALHLLLPILFGLPLIAVAIWAVVSRALRPVHDVATAVRGLDARRPEPVLVDGALPEEIEPLVSSLDALMSRVTEALDHERRFTADAAHELRTPLAAVKIQAQVARRAAEEGIRSHALDQVLSGVERMTHLVEQLLTLARLDPDAQGAADAPVDLAELAESVCSVLTPQALRRHQSLELEPGGGLVVYGNRWWLEVLIRNLVDNALRYSPEGGRVVVQVDDGAASLTIADNGPGIAPEQRQQMLTRFARGAGNDADGCGLGLSIVARIVDIAGARLDFEPGLLRDNGHGLAVVVRFPNRAVSAEA